MLEYHYDMVDYYLDRKDYELILMDTGKLEIRLVIHSSSHTKVCIIDSEYLALSADTFEELVKPELRESFEQNKHKYLPRVGNMDDLRTPGLFKVRA